MLVHDFKYDFNPLNGNLSSREDVLKGLKEEFNYDNLDRLTDIYKNKTLTMHLDYQANGNIDYKSGWGKYQYDKTGFAGPHAVTSVTNQQNKDVTNQKIDFNRYNMVEEITNTTTGEKMNFTYGPGQTRKISRYTSTAGNITKYYFGNMEKTITSAGNEEQVLFLGGGNGLSAIYVTGKNDDGTYEKLYHVLTDHLGSLVALADENGNITHEQSFDAWGNFRDPGTWGETHEQAGIFGRGYTGHEHIAAFDLVNMNGRVYDPYIARFLSPDNYVQMPGSSQGFNRYSYCLNNPLVYTDPSGEIWNFLPWVINTGMVAGWSYLFAKPGLDHAQSQGYGYNDWQTYAYGAASWGVNVGATIASAGVGGLNIPFSNTLSIMAGSLVNSTGNYAITGGQTDVSIGFGVASYNFTQREWGYLGKKGNSALENIGYGLGGLANISDVLTGFNPGEVELQTENLSNANGKDLVGHSQLNDGGNVLIDYGPTGDWAKFEPGRNDWINYASGGRHKLVNDIPGTKFDPVTIKGVNVNRLNRISSRLNSNPGNYQVLTKSCSSVASRALTLSGAPAMGLHPYLLHAQMYMRGLGVRPSIYSYFLY